MKQIINPAARNNWIETSKIFFDKTNEGEEYLSEVINETIDDNSYEFQRFFKAVLDKPNYQLAESHFVYLPLGLIPDQEYKGNIEIGVNYFDDIEREGSIPIDKFYFFVKLAAVFHARHVDPSFDPWDGIKKLDELQRKYEAQPFTAFDEDE